MKSCDSSVGISRYHWFSGRISAECGVNLMDAALIPVVAGFVGTLVGGLSSFAVVWIQQRTQERQNRAHLVVDTAIKAYESAEKHAEFMANQGEQIVTPELAYYIILHTKLVDALASGKAITTDEWVEAHRGANQVHEAIAQMYSSKKVRTQ